MKLWTATESSRLQSIIYAATTTPSGGKFLYLPSYILLLIHIFLSLILLSTERLRRPAAFHFDSGIPNTVVNNGADTERVLGAVSLAFAALAGLAVAALIFVLLARKRYI